VRGLQVGCLLRFERTECQFMFKFGFHRIQGRAGDANPVRHAADGNRHALRPQDDQSDNGAEYQLPEADIEHGLLILRRIGGGRFFRRGFGVGMKLGVGQLFRLYGGLVSLGLIMQRLLEIAQGAAQIPAHVAQLLGAEQDQHDEGDEQEFGNTKVHDSPHVEWRSG